MKKQLTKKEYWELVGLLSLADHYMKMLKSIEDAAIAITGEKDNMGHTADAIFDDTLRNADSLMKKLNLTRKLGC